MAELGRPTILDGEIVALDDAGRSSFQHLQAYELGKEKPSLCFYCFDLLELEGKSTRKLPLEERKAKLQALIPEKHTAIVVLNNAETALPKAVAENFLSRYLNLPFHDRIGAMKQSLETGRKKSAEADAAFEAGRLPHAPATLPLSAYAGEWFHPAFGKVSMTAEGDTLDLHFDAVTLHFRHYNYDTFVASDPFTGRLTASFHLDAQGKITELSIPLERTVKPFVFTRPGKS